VIVVVAFVGISIMMIMVEMGKSLGIPELVMGRRSNLEIDISTPFSVGFSDCPYYRECISDSADSRCSDTLLGMDASQVASISEPSFLKSGKE